ncbi:nicotinate-nucleotide adenylyltransferase [Haloimpatiens sp. FM7330]|uniref:nicotinate-nucleotide adenylyltransferase n=1 Tax=Haloimpatiens sp. FM7330 TaxID=3298610 RepID=UPI00362CE3FD
MKKKAIFGGTFDPIHNGHLHIAYEALYKFNLDKVIFMPSGNPPHKTHKVITDANVRCKLVELAIKNEEKFEISYYEVLKKGLSFTYETLEFFNKSEKDTQWYFITGVDCLMEIDTWKNVKKILSNCKFTVFNRTGYNIYDILYKKNEVEEKYKEKIEFLNIPILDISSTKIRKMIKNGQEVFYLLPHTVNEYIKDNRLYRSRGTGNVE